MVIITLYMSARLLKTKHKHLCTQKYAFITCQINLTLLGLELKEVRGPRKNPKKPASLPTITITVLKLGMFIVQLLLYCNAKLTQ